MKDNSVILNFRQSSAHPLQSLSPFQYLRWPTSLKRATRKPRHILRNSHLHFLPPPSAANSFFKIQTTNPRRRCLNGSRRTNRSLITQESTSLSEPHKRPVPKARCRRSVLQQTFSLRSL